MSQAIGAAAPAVPPAAEPARAADARVLVAVALGRRPADLVVRGGTLANVYTGELLPGWGVAVAGGRIALVGPEAEQAIGPGTTVIDAQGDVIAPGYIDGHTHLDYLHRLDHYLAAAIPTGLTTVVTETAVLSGIGGLPAVQAFLAAFPSLPITVFATAPVISHLLSDRGDGRPMIEEEELARLLEEPAVVGLGEGYWTAVLDGRDGLGMLIAKAQALGKTVEGHTAGARGAKLAAAVAAGFDSCHEPITAEQVLARLRLGLFTMVREGSIRRDTAALAGGLPATATRRLMLASDSVWAPDLLRHGYLDEAARQAVSRGLSPMQALQAVTLAPAEHFRLEARLGGIAPGRQADLLLLPNLQVFRPRLVIARGRIVARDGAVTVPIPPVTLPPDCLPAPRLPADFGRDLLAVRGPAGPSVRIRTIHLAGEILTEERVREVRVQQGLLHPGGDLLKVVVLDRYGRGQVARGFVSGFGMRGAVATSICFDTGNLVLLGADDGDMLAAGERMRAMGGGVVVVAGRVLAEVPLPLGGVTSQEPMPVFAGQLVHLNQTLRALGCVRADPFLSLQVLTFTAIPALRIRERGLWDVRRNQIVPLLAEGPGG
jgi:adenine deaminase